MGWSTWSFWRWFPSATSPCPGPAWCSLVRTRRRQRKITIFHGEIHYKWPFSIAMLNYQRVPSGKHTKSDGKIHHVSWENSLRYYFDCAIFNSYVNVYQRVTNSRILPMTLKYASKHTYSHCNSSAMETSNGPLRDPRVVPNWWRLRRFASMM